METNNEDTCSCAINLNTALIFAYIKQHFYLYERSSSCFKIRADDVRGHLSVARGLPVEEPERTLSEFCSSRAVGAQRATQPSASKEGRRTRVV